MKKGAILVDFSIHFNLNVITVQIKKCPFSISVSFDKLKLKPLKKRA